MATSSHQLDLMAPREAGWKELTLLSGWLEALHCLAPCSLHSGYMSDEDEDGIPYWDKIPDYVKERNLIIMRPNGKDYFKIPMPYGFNVFLNMGTAMTESAYGGKRLTKP